MGIFVTLDNPDKDMQHQALRDYATGLKNKNCYTRELEVYTHQFRKKSVSLYRFCHG